MNVTWRTGRAAVFSAVSLLKQDGYETGRIAGTNRHFDIIAWKGNKSLCIVIRSSKRYTVSSYPEQLATLADMVRSGSAPGEVQFWLYRRPGWAMYKVQPGGAILIDRREA